MEDSSLYKNRAMWRYRGGQLEGICDPVVIEAQLSIFVNRRELVQIACSPRDLVDLAVGYLLAEGILTEYDDLLSAELRPGDQVWIETRHPVKDEGKSTVRYVNTCLGKGMLSPGISPGNAAGSGLKFSARNLLKLITELDDQADTFKKTGGVHSAGLGQADRLMARYEDIGRHNAVDKAFGWAFRHRVSLEDKCLVLSGRIAGEILMKAVQNGVPLVLSRSAPTLKTVELAEEMGITIVGFARGERFNLYTHPERIEV